MSPKELRKIKAMLKIFTKFSVKFYKTIFDVDIEWQRVLFLELCQIFSIFDYYLKILLQFVMRSRKKKRYQRPTCKVHWYFKSEMINLNFSQFARLVQLIT